MATLLLRHPKQSAAAVCYRFIQITLLLATLSFGTGAFAADLGKAELTSELGKLVSSSSVQKAKIAVTVYSPGDTLLIYSCNSDVSMTPASVQKLYTAMGSLHSLGENYRFQTLIGYRGKIKSGVLNGDLVIYGSGDPSWVEDIYPDGPYHVFEQWADSLKVHGITRIKGNLVVDLSAFPTVEYNSTWDPSDRPFYYAPSVSPLSYNANMVCFDLKGGAAPGKAVKVKPRFGYSYYKYKNRMKTSPTSGEVNTWLEMAANQRSVILNGRLGINTSDYLKAAVRNPANYTMRVISKVFNNQGIAFKGKYLVETKTPKSGSAHILFSYESVDLKQILRVTLKTSLSMMAETLWYKTETSQQSVASYITSVLKGIGVSEDKFRIADGCGLSRQNQLTAGQMGVMLCHAYNQEWFGSFFDALAIPGEKGTLANRFRGFPAKVPVFAKTGSMKDISNLAGYVRAEDGKLYAFVVLCNEVSDKTSVYKLQEGICDLISHYKGD